MKNREKLFSAREKSAKVLEILNEGAGLLLFADSTPDLTQKIMLMREAAKIHLTVCEVIKKTAFHTRKRRFINSLKRPHRPLFS